MARVNHSLDILECPATAIANRHVHNVLGGVENLQLGMLALVEPIGLTGVVSAATVRYIS